MIDSGLFVGTLRHRRFTPVAHAFTYPLFMVLLDIDRVPELMHVSAVTSYNRWNWASFDSRDHLGDPSRPLRERLVVDATRHGIELPAGSIFLLTHLRYHGTPDWIEQYIFPGGELASVGEILKSLARTKLALYHAENCGAHYAHTLRAWRARFHHHLARVRALGFNDRFIRMWDLYLGSCEATFLERHTGLFQLVLLKNGAQRVLFNEPWSEAGARPRVQPVCESAA